MRACSCMQQHLFCTKKYRAPTLAPPAWFDKNEWWLISVWISLPCNNNNNSKWSKNFDKRPHRCLIIPRGGDWTGPTLTPSVLHDSLCSLSQPPQTASRSVQPFSQGSQTWPTDRQTDHYSMCRNRPLPLAIAVMCGLIIIIYTF